MSNVLAIADPNSAEAIARRFYGPAPWVRGIRANIVKLTESAAVANDTAWNAKQRQLKRLSDAERDERIIEAAFANAPAEHRTPEAEQMVEDAKHRTKAEREKLDNMGSLPSYGGLALERLDAFLTKTRVAQQPRADLKTLAKATAAMLPDATADVMARRAAWLEILKSPRTLDEAQAIGEQAATRFIKRYRKPFYVGGAFNSDVDVKTGRVTPRTVEFPADPFTGVPDALSLFLHCNESVFRAGIKRKIQEAHELKYSFEGQMSVAERDKQAKAAALKLAKAEEHEAAVIRALVLEGESVVIRRDINLKTLFGTEPVPAAQEAFDAEQERIRKQGGTHAGVGSRGPTTFLSEASGFAGPGRAK